MRKLIRKILENIAGAIGDITFLNWNERNITVNWNYEVGTDKVTLSFHNRLSRLYLFKYFMVVWVICSHDSIPKIEIQTVVTIKKSMMHIVMG